MKKIIVAVATLVAGAVVAQLVNLYLTRDITDAAFANIYSVLTTPVTPLWLLLLLAACTFFLIGLGIADMVKIAKLQERIVELTCAEATQTGPVTIEDVQLGLGFLYLDELDTKVVLTLAAAREGEGDRRLTAKEIANHTTWPLLDVEHSLDKLIEKGLASESRMIRGQVYELTPVGREWILSHRAG